MLLLVAGLALFFTPHVLTILRRPRAEAIGALGEGAYKGVYSLVTLAGLVLIIIGFGQAPYIELWPSPVWARHLALPLVWIAFVLVAAAYVPTGKIKEKAKHPMLAGVKLWALTHLIVNGDLASLLLFGSFLVYGVIDRIAVKRRGAPLPGPGRPANDVLAIVIGTIAFLLFGLYIHPNYIGVPVFPG
ncbi:hypothetical protein GCM10007276_25290 [Agaricicola taiwanensis]|uniref:NnrU domain-containing protein n=1 Tax=Agaricicola taiwanensis TaxID=591372 RepID=A0A8J3DWL9_9RHOB|nr:NnrU family protein [Agaricicola taiwanensis]GGE47037.1 hypothetical protein GCM10007276_25290 [Agaricicola taiwanensis]